MTATSKIEIPEFPKNDRGLVRGSLLKSKSERTLQVGLPVGTTIPIGFDGTYVRCTTLTWSIERISDEILDDVWEVTGEVVDLSNEERSMEFARRIEQMGLDTLVKSSNIVHCIPPAYFPYHQILILTNKDLAF